MTIIDNQWCLFRNLDKVSWDICCSYQAKTRNLYDNALLTCNTGHLSCHSLKFSSDDPHGVTCFIMTLFCCNYPHMVTIRACCLDEVYHCFVRDCQWRILPICFWWESPVQIIFDRRGMCIGRLLDQSVRLLSCGIYKKDVGKKRL